MSDGPQGFSLHPFHQEIFVEIERHVAENKIPLDLSGAGYVSTTKVYYLFYAADFRKVYGDFVKRHPDLTTGDLVELLDSLSQGETYNEFIGVGILLGAYPKLRARLDPVCLETWLDRAQGWAEVDTICQTTFTAKEILANWEAWHTLLDAFAHSENIHKRRASLVLLTRPLRESDDPRLADLALANVEMLKGEKAILITKAVSWVLRAMVRHHRAEVERYLAANVDSLPKVAVRETRNVLEGGVKQKRRGEAGKSVKQK